ncbi:phage tail protein [Acaryochloris sp. CCMEE 5410]|uniref:phage tail protein n=1 Tax=Acaryochloris sp. CCMEE 5410 TaxID=310037 RepID=UPI0021D15BA0|nr:phage tail protein [Acaryochloris sp. CCMEE 5410]KAI9130413.1 phage tail protein [Acaryochloris sp. CCMEE 5410]
MPDLPEILTRSRFYLELKLEGSQDSVDGIFMECSGFQSSQEVIEVVEVTPQLWGKQGKTKGRNIRTKIPGNATYSNLTLKRGLMSSMTLWNWLQKVQDGDWAEQRREGALVIYNQGAKEQCRLEFQGAWPVSYKISDLDVKSGEHNIEEVEITVESVKRVEVTA